MSLPGCITLRTVKGSVLSWAELDTNFVCLNTLINSKAGVGGNRWYIPSGETISIASDYQYFFYGDILIEGTLDLASNSQLVVVNGNISTGSTGTINNSGVIKNVFLPTGDTKVNGLEYSGNVLTISQSDGTSFSATVITSGSNNSPWISSSGTSSAILSDSTSIAYNNFSVAQGYDTKAYGESSHAEGTLTKAGWKGFYISSVSNGVINLDTYYGDVTSQFVGIPNNVIIRDSSNNNISLPISAITYDLILSSTTIYLNDITVNYGEYVAHIANMYSDYANNYFGYASHSSGYQTYAIGEHSHSEGSTGIYAYGYASHAEGFKNVAAYGRGSHAEGTSGVIAFGEASHAEGKNVISFGDFSHAEGSYTASIGESSHAEGNNTKATSKYSHSEGDGTKAGWKGFIVNTISNGIIYLDEKYGDVSSEFSSNILISNISGKFNYESVIFTGTSTEIKLYNKSINGLNYVSDINNLNSEYAEFFVPNTTGSHAEGYQSKSLGLYSHAEGGQTTANGDLSHAEGNQTIANGYNSHAEGLETVAYGHNSHSEGSVTKAYARNSHSQNRYNKAGWVGLNIQSITDGVIKLDSSYGDVTDNFNGEGSYGELLLYVDPSSGDNKILSYNKVTFSSTTNTEIFLNDTSISNGTAVADITNINNLYLNDFANQVNKGEASHAEGSSTKAIGNFSHSEGYNTKAIGHISHASGSDTEAIGRASHAEGYNTKAYGNYSHSEGINNYSYGRSSHSQNDGNKAGWVGLNIQSVSDGIITLSSSYGNVTNNFGGEGNSGELLLYVEPALGDNKILPYYNVTFSSTTNTEIFLYDTSISDGSAVADIGNINNLYLNDFANELNRGRASHAEGSGTKAIGNYSHAEGGGTKAIGHISHASGEETEAIGRASHAEGYLTKAIGHISHASGEETEAIGRASHAEGYGTVALGNYQHVSGKFNYYSGLTTEGAFIIGNGTDDTNRSNLLVAGDNQVTIYGDLSATTMSATSITIGGLGVVKKYTTTLTFSDSETKTITHGLDTKFIHCSVWDVSSNELISPEIVRLGGSETASLNITIATAGNYDILITG